VTLDAVDPLDAAKPLSGNYNDRVNHGHNLPYHDLQRP
jgi:hypothetical protein